MKSQSRAFKKGSVEGRGLSLACYRFARISVADAPSIILSSPHAVVPTDGTGGLSGMNELLLSTLAFQYLSFIENIKESFHFIRNLLLLNALF